MEILELSREKGGKCGDQHCDKKFSSKVRRYPVGDLLKSQTKDHPSWDFEPAAERQ